MGSVFRSMAKSSFFKGFLRSFGAAAVAGLGWKIASDVYDGVKARMGRPPRETDEEWEQREQKS